jgi:hypothetical protein
MDSDADSTPIRWIRPSGGLEFHEVGRDGIPSTLSLEEGL